MSDNKPSSSFDEMLRDEKWRHALEKGGYRIVKPPVESDEEAMKRKQKASLECQKCGKMYPSTSLCPCC